jgi:hypothetical protein
MVVSMALWIQELYIGPAGTHANGNIPNNPTNPRLNSNSQGNIDGPALQNSCRDSGGRKYIFFLVEPVTQNTYLQALGPWLGMVGTLSYSFSHALT